MKTLISITLIWLFWATSLLGAASFCADNKKPLHRACWVLAGGIGLWVISIPFDDSLVQGVFLVGAICAAILTAILVILAWKEVSGEEKKPISTLFRVTICIFVGGVVFAQVMHLIKIEKLHVEPMVVNNVTPIVSKMDVTEYAPETIMGRAGEFVPIYLGKLYTTILKMEMVDDKVRAEVRLLNHHCTLEMVEMSGLISIQGVQCTKH